jgi:hypothetical protein
MDGYVKTYDLLTLDDPRARLEGTGCSEPKDPRPGRPPAEARATARRGQGDRKGRPSPRRVPPPCSPGRPQGSPLPSPGAQDPQRVGAGLAPALGGLLAPALGGLPPPCSPGRPQGSPLPSPGAQDPQRVGAGLAPALGSGATPRRGLPPARVARATARVAPPLAVSYRARGRVNQKVDPCPTTLERPTCPLCCSMS